jgi:methyl-accepting chemotaxis protein
MTGAKEQAMTEEVKPPIFRRKYLINRRFQLKYTLIFLLLAAVVAGILGYLLYHTVRENSQLISMDNPDANEAVQTLLGDQDLQVLYRIFGLLGGMVVAIAFVGIFVTHQIAGPALVLTRNLNFIAQGKLPVLRPLRKGDELGELFEALHAAVARLELEMRSDADIIERATTALSPGNDKLREEMQTIAARLKQYLPKQMPQKN